MCGLKLKRRHFLKKSEVGMLANEIRRSLGASIPLEDVEVAFTQDGDEVYFHRGQLLLVRRGNRLFPSLRSLLDGLFTLPKVVVDMGAVPHVANGADVMLPGIRAVDGSVKAGSLVMVVDEKHGKPVAVGESLLDAEAINAGGKGRAIKNLHWVGDDYWLLSNSK
ncbi:MAG: DUF1947 domain-containing protein [Candidatus Freyarchaeota archaeon]|nr:DUF1947 domain-containing protein [Candidatus Jordarchaeia archaeon]